MRLHAAIRRPREALQEGQGRAPGRLRHPGFPLQPVHAAGPGGQRHHPVLLPDQLRGLVPGAGQDGRQRRQGRARVRVDEGADPGVVRIQEDQVEL